jgi:hypothetical protein
MDTIGRSVWQWHHQVFVVEELMKELNNLSNGELKFIEALK